MPLGDLGIWCMQQYYKLVGAQNVFIYTITQLYFVVCAQNVYIKL